MRTIERDVALLKQRVAALEEAAKLHVTPAQFEAGVKAARDMAAQTKAVWGEEKYDWHAIVRAVIAALAQ